MKSARAFTIVELLIALLVAAFGLAGLLRLFVESTRTAHRAQRRVAAELLGMGLIAEWQALSAAEVHGLIADADGVFPEEPEVFAVTGDSRRPISWQWQWDEPLATGQPLPLTLKVSSDWNDPGEAVQLETTL